MAFRLTKWTALKMTEPKKFRAELLRRLRSREGNVTHTAEDMDVNKATLKRWIASAGLRDDVEEMRVA